MNIACTEILNVTPVDATPRTRNVDDMELSQPTDPGPIQTTKPSMSTDRSLQSIDPAELHAQLVSKTEKSILEKLTQLEAEFLASIGQHSLHHRQRIILAEMRQLVEKVNGITLQQKRQLHLSMMASSPIIQNKAQLILECSGFNENKALQIDVENLTSSVRAAPTCAETREKYNAEKTRLLKRAEEIQQKMHSLMIKVNLPRNDIQFYNNTGEGCFCLVDPETKSKFDSSLEGGTYIGILLNSPLYKEWFHLQAGDPILFTLRGRMRPVAFARQSEAIVNL